MAPERRDLDQLIAQIEGHEEFAAHLRMRVAQLEALWWRDALGEEAARQRRFAIDDVLADLADIERAAGQVCRSAYCVVIQNFFVSACCTSP